MTAPSQDPSSPKNDRPVVADTVYAACLQAEASGSTTVSLTGIYMHGHCPLRTGTDEVFTYNLADILASMRDAGGYTKDITSFRAALTQTHGKDPQMIAPKRMHTSVESLYRGFGRKAMNAVLRAVDADWWKTDKQIKQEALILRVLKNGGVIPTVESSTPTPAPAPQAVGSEVAAFLAAHGVAAPAPAPAPASTDLEAIIANLTGTTPQIATHAEKVLSVESTKVELVAAVVAAGVMDEAQASLLNKTTLASLI